ncbi:hypothetical protein RRG08_060062 [Elysia crispata]|uniref:Uncharacterized protein n=1 Tax=Elysia crispata TaxID=231223 RepID=A0AAE0Y060_9GAST|nr:hypothetical protein RRG08_060062 [Elysia crispata]
MFRGNTPVEMITSTGYCSDCRLAPGLVALGCENAVAAPRNIELIMRRENKSDCRDAMIGLDGPSRRFGYSDALE